MKKIFALLLAVLMVVSLVACTGNEGGAAGTPGAAADSFKDPYAGIEDYDELSRAVYDDVLGEFYKYYQEAMEETSESMRYAKMAIAEAKLLSAGIFLPTTSQGGNYAMTKIAPYTNTPILFGNDTYRFHDRVVTNEPIKAEDIAAMKAKWTELVGTGEYEAYVKSYLAEKGYTIKDTATFYFDADPTYWDVLATSYAADSEILVQTYDGLIEYNMENQPIAALAESYEVSEDGLTYTFKIRQGVTWVDNQNRKVADLKADDFVAGMQHMMDAQGGLEYLVCAGCANIVNADEYIAGTVTDFAEVGVKAVDDYTLQYTLTQPTSYFPTMLGYGVFAPMSRSYYESKGGKFGEEFDSTADSYLYGKGPDSIAYCGPYVITSFTSNNSIVLEANKSYWNKDGNNLKSFTYMYTDGTDHQKMYDDFFNGVVDTLGMTTQRVEIAKNKGTFNDFAYVSETDATTYCGFLNLNRTCYATGADKLGESKKTDDQKARAEFAMLNQHFRLAVVQSIDRGTYNAQSVGEDLKLNSLVNSYTPGTYVNLAEEITVQINGTDKTYPAGTFYGQIMQDQLDADGVALKVWNGTSSAGFDGWYNVEAAKAELKKAIEELKAQGLNISKENPIYLDFPVRGDSDVSKNQKNVMKQSIEAVTDGCIIINLVEYATRDDYLAATYRFNVGADANYDLNDGSGWGPDYGDPSTYLGTMLPDYAGYMTKSLGIF
ncbi:MAG: peptide ABC transporter substrate-binding protein [Oscillospiraceae bacterium]|nr:peptide ABC transporter substrate-binding protein [Oscillospiraceae bacterium]